MNTTTPLIRIGLIFLLTGVTGGAQETQPVSTQPALSTDWDPPVSDAPAQRMGGASRGDSGDPDLYVAALAPKTSVGLTAAAQPVLYWYLSKATPHKIQITLRPLEKVGTVKDVAPTLFDVTLDGKEPGLYSFDLAHPPGGAAAVTLEPGVEYKWVVEVLAHRADGSSDPTAECRLMRIREAPPELAEVKEASPQRYAACLKAGLWYDAIATLNAMIGRDKGNPGLLETRRRLLQKQDLLAETKGSIDRD